MYTKTLTNYTICKEFTIKRAIIFNENDVSYLYNTLNGRGLFLKESLLKKLLNGKVDENFLFLMIQRGIFETNDNIIDLHDSKPTFFLINLTDSCNLRCMYCFRDVHIKESVNINSNELKKICQKIIEYCKNHKVNRIFVQPWGGEPLISYEKIIEIDDIFRQTDLEYQIVLSTNATLVTSEVARALFHRKVHVGISLDGNEELQNLQRPFKNRETNSFQEVCKGIQNLRDAGYGDIGVICTITKINIDRIEDILNVFINEIKLHTVKLNLVKTNPFSPESEYIAVSDTDKINRFYDVLIDTIINTNRRGYNFFERNLCDKIVNLFGNNTGNICVSRGCLGGDKMIAVNRQGDIFPCDLVDVEKVKIGNLFSDFTVPDMIEQSKKENPFFQSNVMEICNECPWKIYCEGGCSASVIYNGEKGQCVDHLECRINQILYPKLLSLALKNPEAIWYLTNKKIKIL